jgi:hypothetical protein
MVDLTSSFYLAASSNMCKGLVGHTGLVSLIGLVGHNDFVGCILIGIQSIDHIGHNGLASQISLVGLGGLSGIASLPVPAPMALLATFASSDVGLIKLSAHQPRQPH